VPQSHKVSFPQVSAVGGPWSVAASKAETRSGTKKRVKELGEEERLAKTQRSPSKERTCFFAILHDLATYRESAFFTAPNG
jgi:hypothetical protein